MWDKVRLTLHGPLETFQRAGRANGPLAYHIGCGYDEDKIGVTHVPTGHLICTTGTPKQARAVIADLLEAPVDWQTTNVRYYEQEAIGEKITEAFRQHSTQSAPVIYLSDLGFMMAAPPKRAIPDNLMNGGLEYCDFCKRSEIDNILKQDFLRGSGPLTPLIPMRKDEETGLWVCEDCEKEGALDEQEAVSPASVEVAPDARL